VTGLSLQCYELLKTLFQKQNNKVFFLTHNHVTDFFYVIYMVSENICDKKQSKM